jgi:hypothetical protein
MCITLSPIGFLIPQLGKSVILLIPSISLSPMKGFYLMPYLINLIDVDGCQLVFSSEMAPTSAQAIEQIARLQRYALSQAWPQARITVTYGATWSYSVTDVVDEDRLRNDDNEVARRGHWANVVPEAGPCPDAPELPWGWDQIDYPDPTWAERYDD